MVACKLSCAAIGGLQLYVHALAAGVPTVPWPPMPWIWKLSPRPSSASLPWYVALKLCWVGSPGMELAAGGLDRPRPSQNDGMMLQVAVGTQPCATPPQDPQVIAQLPALSELTCTPLGAAGPSGPVVICTGVAGVPVPLMNAVRPSS